MTKCISKSYSFPALKGKKVEVNFNGGSISSDSGAIFLREIDRKLNLLAEVAKYIPDKRDPSKVKHSILEMLRQRVFGIALGYEDLNDHDTLRSDDLLRLCVGKDKPLASSPTLCRFENSVTRQIAVDIYKVLVNQFIASYSKPPEEIVLDFDATDDLVPGEQEGRFFHGY